MFVFNKVTELVDFINSTVRNTPSLNDLQVEGEISSYKVVRGNAYISIKDEEAVVQCVMYRNFLAVCDEEPKVGDKVVLRGGFSYYPGNGSFSLIIRYLQKKGEGNLHDQYLKLKEKLRKEGLFDSSHKKPIPVLPRKIGIVTSPTGAVIHDIIDTLKRRNPHFHIIVYPATVQGVNCPPEVISGLNYFENRNDIDVVIVARGGGSFDDLFAFNDERLARRIYDMKIPVISAVGHETDTTICDDVSDLRAPTPTAAAELVMGRYDDLSDFVNQSAMSLDMAIDRFLAQKKQALEVYANHKALMSPLYFADSQLQLVKNYELNMKTIVDKRLITELSNVKTYQEKLDSMNPVNVLKRGYSFVSTEDGTAIDSADKVKPGDSVIIVFEDGKAKTTIDSVDKKE